MKLAYFDAEAHNRSLAFSGNYTYMKKMRGSSYEYESASGVGSRLCATEDIRKALPSIVQSLGVRSILDAPCGDFNWMKVLEPTLSLDRYIGLDIVQDMVIDNITRYGSIQRGFVLGDIVKDSLPKVDMILCRDCLVHLPLKDGVRAVENFKVSGAKYLVSTTYPGLASNSDVAAYATRKDFSSDPKFQVGDWRPVNLELEPFNLGKPFQLINECEEGKRLGVWIL
jgi:hypothetical protein